MDEGRVAFTLGRHTNGYMNSFYADTPAASSWCPVASSATIHVAVYTPLEARLGAHARITPHLAETMPSDISYFFRPF
jgi:hypothetical protein